MLTQVLAAKMDLNWKQATPAFTARSGPDRIGASLRPDMRRKFK